MKISFKDDKFIILIVFLLIILVTVSIIEGYLKEEVIDYEEVNARKEVVTVQESLGYNYVRIANWDKVFNIVKNDTKSYELKDLVEGKIDSLKLTKKWDIKEIENTNDGYLSIGIYAELSNDKINIVYDTSSYAIKKFLLNGEVK